MFQGKGDQENISGILEAINYRLEEQNGTDTEEQYVEREISTGLILREDPLDIFDDLEDSYLSKK